jgi:hypothetical protein
MLHHHTAKHCTFYKIEYNIMQVQLECGVFDLESKKFITRSIQEQYHDDASTASNVKNAIKTLVVDGDNFLKDLANIILKNDPTVLCLYGPGNNSKTHLIYLINMIKKTTKIKESNLLPVSLDYKVYNCHIDVTKNLKRTCVIPLTQKYADALLTALLSYV